MIERLGTLGAANPLAFWLVLAACAYFFVMAVRLTVIDVRHHLLPDRIVFPSYAIAGVLLLGAAASQLLPGGQDVAGTADAGVFGVPGLRVLAGGAALWLFYFLLHAVYPPGMGFGDVKLAGVLGMYLGFLGWGHVWPGLLPRSSSAGCGASDCSPRGAARCSRPFPSGRSCWPELRPPCC